MSKFRGGSSSTNDELLQHSKDEAAKAELKEKERQSRLAMGRERIQAMFNQGGGSYTTAGRHEDYGPSGGPATITERVLTGTRPATKAAMFFGGNDRNEGQRNSGGETGPTPIWSNVTRANPNYKPGGTRWVEGDTHQVDGIADDFYSNFQNSILEYQRPEVAKQHENALSQNLFNLGRRGLLRSSTAADNAAEIAEERTLADAHVSRDAENQTAGLRGDIANAEQRALQLLQQTEDPTAAANAAATEVNAIQGRGPQFNPLGELFRAAAVGYQNYQNSQTNKKYADAVPSRNPYTSSGRTVG